MTLREADVAALRMLPVVHDGIEYQRITQTGYTYDEQGNRHGFVQLLDKCDHSVVNADPARVYVKE
jgi:hypothetical protein